MVGGDAIVIIVPQVYGGMKTPEYLALNPQGLIPSLVFTNGGALWESDVSVFIILSNMCDRPEFYDVLCFLPMQPAWLYGHCLLAGAIEETCMLS